MRDPRHGRDIPTGRDVAQVLRRFFNQIGLHVAQQLRNGQRPDWQRWIKPMVGALQPYMARYFQMGAYQSWREIQAELLRRRQKAARIETKRGDPLPMLLAGFDILNPYIQESILHHTFLFVQETLRTASLDAEEAYMETTRQIMAGMEQGEGMHRLSRRIHRIFDDPMRAFRISTTESSRAVHAGRLEAAKQSKVVTGVKWLASADCCELCAELDGKVVEPGQPFVTNASKHPQYALIYHPPRHPHCMCSTQDEIS